MSGENRSIKIQTEIEVDKAIKDLKDLAKSLSECEEALNGYTEGTEEWNRTTAKIASYHKEIDGNRAKVRAYYKEFKAGNKSINELASEQGRLNRIVRELDPNTKEWRQYASVLNTVKKRSASLHKEFQNTDGTLCKLTKTAAKLSNYAVSLFGLDNITDRLQNLTEDYLTFSDLQADVMKTTGLSATEVENLAATLKTIDTRSSVNELMELATTAGKLGISAKEDVEGFVRAADQINVALGEDLGEGAIREIGKISDVFGLTDAYGIEKAYLKIGSAINSLGQSSTASESYLVEFTQRLAGVAKQAGISVEQILGYGSAMDQNGQNVEMAATAFQGFITKMFSDTATFARIANMDVSAFTELLRNDANQAIRTVLSALSEQGGFQQLIPVFESMNLDGSRAVSVLASMASNIQAVEEAQAEANRSFSEGTSITNEFNVKNNNAAAQVEKMRNRLTEIRVEIGQNLLPVMLTVGNLFNNLSRLMASLTRAIPSTVSEIAALAAALTGLFVARSKTLVPVTSLKAAFIALRLGAAKATGAVKTFFKAFLSNPIGLAVSALSGLAAIILKIREESIKSRKAFNEFQAGLSAETAQIDSLFSVLKTAERGTRDYAEAKKAVIDQYGEYLSGIIDEKGELSDLEEAYKRVTAAVKDRWASEALAKRTAEINEKYFEKEAKQMTRLREAIPDSPRREYQINRIMEYNRPYLHSEEADSFFASIGLGNMSRDDRRKIGAYRSQIRTKEITRKALIDHEQQKYAPFLSDYELKAEIQQLEAGLERLNNQKKFGAKLGLKIDTKGLDAEIAYMQRKLEALRPSLNPAVAPEAGSKDSMLPSDGTGGGPIHPEKEEPQPADKLEELRQAGERARALLDELLEKGEQAQRTADQIEIDNIREKYQEELSLAIQYRNELMRILNDPSARKEETSYARENIGPAAQAVAEMERLRDEEIQQARERQQKERWSAWTTLKNTDYSQPSLMDQRDKALEGVDQWENEEIQKSQESFRALGLAAGSSEYLSEFQALEEMQTRIHEEAVARRAEIDRNYEKAKLQGIAQGIQSAQQLLQEASNTVSQLKELELTKAEAVYDQELESLEQQLDRKQISKKTYNDKVEKLEEERTEREKQIQKKYLLAEFAMQVAQIISTTALAAMQAYQAGAAVPIAGVALGPAAAAAAAAFGAVQIGIATAQYNLAKGYSKGGFTPQGGKEEPAGIVHKGEYVVPQWVLRTPQGLNYVQLLEAIRTNKIPGYQAGGATGGAFPVSAAPAGSPEPGLAALSATRGGSSEEIAALLASIDRKLNGVSLVYLDRQLKDLNRKYEQARKNFGVSVP